MNITRFLRSGEPPDGAEWWIVDEASMVDSRQWDALLARAEETGTRVLAVGDPAQLGAVGPGGLFTVMVDDPDLATAELEQVWRMEAEWEKAASLKLRARDPAAADAYAEHGRIRDHDNLEELLDDLAAVHNEGQDVLVMAGSNRRVDAFGDAMQARLIRDRDPVDELVIRWDDDEAGSRERTVGVGDRIRTRRNDYQLVTTKGATVVNGATWEVTRVYDGGLWVHSDDRGQVLLPASYLNRRDDDTGRPFVELAYASTVHSAQGRTVDQAVMVVDARTEAELLYVGMSRGRVSNIAVAEGGDEDGRTLFEAALQNPSTETVAALNLIAGHREAMEAEAARKAAREREAAEKEAREQAERERAEREAAAVRWGPDDELAEDVEDWVRALPNGLAIEAVANEAAVLWGSWVDTDEVVADYGREQLRRAKAWARSLLAGYNPKQVGATARIRYTVDEVVDDPAALLTREYTDAAQSRITNAAVWMDEDGIRWDDDEQGDLAGVVAGEYGITPERAAGMVIGFDKYYRARAVAAVKELPGGLTKAQEAQQIIDDWRDTRYIDAAMDALQKRHQPPERETPEQDRGGYDFG